MKRYEIRCTETQTRKALELGAPIKHKEVTDFEGHLLDYNITEIPTAEEMAGWLKDVLFITSWHITYYPTHEMYGFLIIGEGFVIEHDASEGIKYLHANSKDATLASIDAALEYLSNNK